MKVKNEKKENQQIRPFWKMKRIVLGIPLLLLLVLGTVGYKIGMNLASDKMVDELSSQITKEDYDKILKDPSIQQIIDKEVGTDKNSELLKNLSSDPDPAIQETATPVQTKVDSTKKENPAATKIDSDKVKDTVATVDTDKGKTETKTEEKQQPTGEKEEPGLHFNSSSEAMKFLLSKFSMGELSALAKKAEGGVTPQEKEEIKSTVLARLSTEEYNALKVFAVVEASKRK
ncbi:hypothetical protein [Neobacillus sp. SuZ13]|uniref:hypothetical protein n=1 Tax=Neobacillus sp. SuZ13 TaxID=3047875 RepID=UPI0024C09DB1|nr:hypothetical protein [Neobacillus sp. SuZ13]WHY66541.1 hypothetical protein QNH17_26390 [Neobacillus sp. SuZ13]